MLAPLVTLAISCYFQLLTFDILLPNLFVWNFLYNENETLVIIEGIFAYFHSSSFMPNVVFDHF